MYSCLYICGCSTEKKNVLIFVNDETNEGMMEGESWYVELLGARIGARDSSTKMSLDTGLNEWYKAVYILQE